jgi:hypothetical protein
LQMARIAMKMDWLKALQFEAVGIDFVLIAWILYHTLVGCQSVEYIRWQLPIWHSREACTIHWWLLVVLALPRMKTSASSIALFLSRLVMFKDQLFGQLSINLVMVFGGAGGSIHPAQPWWDTFPHLCTYDEVKTQPASTFVHSFVMTVSTTQTFILQGYGSPGQVPALGGALCDILLVALT